MSSSNPPEEPGPAPVERGVDEVVDAIRQQLGHLERLSGAGRLADAERRAAREIGHLGQELVPAWRRATEGEHRLPVAGVIGVAIALELVLPARLVFHPPWLLPALEIALAIGLVAANPRRINRSSRLLRAASLTLIAAISMANAWSAATLIRDLLDGHGTADAATLLGEGAAIYLTNVIVFGLWYWEFDRGGPVARAQGIKPYPDFLFPQMESPELAPPEWEATFIDYLYVSFTNATAFSPTDVLPLSRWAKELMLLQSAISLSTVALVVARAVNIFKT